MSSQCLPDQRELLKELTESVEKERKTQNRQESVRRLTMEPVIDPSRYEQWLTLIRVTAFVRRGVRAFKSGTSAGSQRAVSRGVARCQVELVPADTTGGVPSRVYTLFQNGCHFSFLLFTCKLALVASFLNSKFKRTFSLKRGNKG